MKIQIEKRLYGIVKEKYSSLEYLLEETIPVISSNNLRMLPRYDIFSAVLFYMNSLLGAIKYHIPYINWPAGLMMIKELGCMLYGSNKETRYLQEITDSLLQQTEKLERRLNWRLDK